jgi:hypothetical protein
MTLFLARENFSNLFRRRTKPNKTHSQQHAARIHLQVKIARIE